MKIKNLLSIFSFLTILLFAACGNDSSKNEVKTNDSLNEKLPAELTKLNEQIAADPKDAGLYHKRAKYYLTTKNYEAGFNDMKKAMFIDSSKAEYYITLSDLYFLTNQTRNAKTALEKCIAMDDKNVEAILKLGELYYFVQQYDKSFEYINMALKIDQYNAKAYFMKGMAYKEIKDTAKAISSMQTAVEQDPLFYNAYMQLGILNAAQKKLIAIDYYKNALRIQPTSTETWYAIGKFYQDVENWDKAIEAYGALLKIDPKHKNANFNMGVIYFDAKKNFIQAMKFYNSAIEIDPTFANAYYARGLCYQAMGDKKSAELDFKTCLKIDPKHEPAIDALKGI